MPHAARVDVEKIFQQRIRYGRCGERNLTYTNMKKVIYALILPLVVVSGLVFANREIKNETSKKSIPKPLSAAEREAALKQWEATLMV